jgi:predicted alpha/beta superfamily hydrolase
MKQKFLTSIVLIFVFVTLSAQEGYTVKRDSLQSDILKQNRKLSIVLPEGYNDKNAKFPVIYVLDADGRLQHSAMTARFLFQNNKMPRAILVGVFNIDRNHDFLPDSSQSAPTGGGADNFIKFFKQELIPYIDKNFNTEPFKVLIGHSYGGVFAVHALLSDPDLFNAYIAIDPSLWYKNQMLIKNASAEFLKTKNWSKSIYITGPEGEGTKGMGITPMEKLLKSSAPTGLNWKVVAYADEDHGSVPFKSVYDGFRYIFDTGSNFSVLPLAGILPKGTSTYAFIQNYNPHLRFTIDGTEPTLNSPLCKEQKIKINKPCTLKVKSISGTYNNTPVVTRLFTEGKFMDGLQSAENLKQGLKYSYYEGVWDSLPDFSRLTPIKTGITENLDLKFALKNDSFAARFEGFIHVTEKGLYNLWVISDDGSKVLFNNQVLLDNNGLHSADNAVAKLVPLNPGYYPVMIEFFEKTGDQAISIGLLPNVKNPKPVPLSKGMFFYKE